MKKILLCSCVFAAFAAFAPAVSAQTASTQEVSVSWSTSPIDGRFTGVTAATAENVPESMGKVKGRTYHSPSGRKFRRGTARKAASVMLAAQPAMAVNKKVIAHSRRPMLSDYPQSELYDWYVDELMRAVQDSTGKKVDVGITNRGGVRIDMPEGDILHDDIMSMFPFRNHICHVALHGRDLRVIFDQMAATSFQIVGGARIVAKDGKIVSVSIDGEPLDDEKVYGVATLDFLLYGGDGYNVARNALEITECKSYLYDTMLEHIRRTESEGKLIEFEKQGWITIMDSADEDDE